MKPAVDLEKLRVALRRMSRGNLLMVAERAIEILPRTRLRTLVGDMVRLEDLAEGKRGAAPLLAEVRKFHDASLGGEYYESFAVKSKNFMEKSEGTEAFIAEFDRLIGKCIHAAAKGPHAPVRGSFDLLFALLRRIDDDPDSVVFFADEAGAWQVDVDWRTVLCLPRTHPPAGRVLRLPITGRARISRLRRMRRRRGMSSLRLPVQNCTLRNDGPPRCFHDEPLA